MCRYTIWSVRDGKKNAGYVDTGLWVYAIYKKRRQDGYGESRAGSALCSGAWDQLL